jgi:hypothetical protein
VGTFGGGYSSGYSFGNGFGGYGYGGYGGGLSVPFSGNVNFGGYSGGYGNGYGGFTTLPYSFAPRHPFLRRRLAEIDVGPFRLIVLRRRFSGW